MSHLSTIEVQFNDLDAIEATCKEMGFTFQRNNRTCKSPWFEHPCEHTFQIPGDQENNVGLFRTKDGKALQLGYDSMYRHITQALGGDKAQRFTQLYGVNKATIEARKRGWMATRQTGKNGNINVVITGV